MRKLLCLSAVAAFAMAFAFVSVADAAPGGNGKGKKKTSAIAASVTSPVVCGGAVADDDPATTVIVGLDEPQCFQYTIEITGVDSRNVLEDMLESNFDLSGGAEDDADAVAEDTADAANEDIANAALQEDLGDGGGVDDCASGDGVCNGDVGNDGTAELETDGLCDYGSGAVSCDGNGLCTGGVLCTTNDSCTDGDCDGITVSNVSVGDTCNVSVARPDSHVKTNPNASIPPKQPEFILIEGDGDDADDYDCDVTIFAETVGNPGSVVFVGGATHPDVTMTFAGGDDDPKEPNCYDPGTNTFNDCVDIGFGEVLFSEFEPGSCRPLRIHTRFDANANSIHDSVPSESLSTTATDGVVDVEFGANIGLPIVDYVALNRGIKQWEGDGAFGGDLMLNGDANTIGTLDTRSIQLEPVGCDTDGGGETDVDELVGSRNPLDPSDDVF